MGEMPSAWSLYYYEYDYSLSGWSEAEVVQELLLLLDEEERKLYENIVAVHHATNHLKSFGGSEEECARFWDFCIDNSEPLTSTYSYTNVAKNVGYSGYIDENSFLPQSGRGRDRIIHSTFEWSEYRIDGVLVLLVVYLHNGKKYHLFPEKEIQLGDVTVPVSTSK